MQKADLDAIMVIKILSKSWAMFNKFEKCWLLLFHVQEHPDNQ